MSPIGRLVVPSTVAAPAYDATQVAATSRRPDVLTATRLQRRFGPTPCTETDRCVPVLRGCSTKRAPTALPGLVAVATTVPAVASGERRAGGAVGAPHPTRTGAAAAPAHTTT